MVNARGYIAAHAEETIDEIVEFLRAEGYTHARINQCLKDYIDYKVPTTRLSLLQTIGFDSPI